MSYPQFLIYHANAALSSSLGRYFNRNTPSQKQTEFCSSVKSIDDNNLDSSDVTDKLASFFAPFLYDKKEISSDFILFEGEHFVLKDLLDDAEKKINSYTTFSSKIKETFTKDKYELLWNDYELSYGKGDGRIIFLFNIHSGTKNLWNNLGQKIFDIGIKQNHFFIFYSFLNVPKVCRLNKEAVESNDKLFGYSRFLRDLIKARGIGYEIIFPLKVEIEDDTIEKIEIIKKKIEISEKDKIIEFKEELNKFKSSIETLYGKDLTEYNFELLAKLYLHNRNRHCEDLEEIQKKFFNVNKKIISDTDSHGELHNKDKVIREFKDSKIKDDKAKDLGQLEYWHSYRKDISPLLNAFINFKNYDKLSFLFIDDNIDAIEPKIELLKVWFDKPNIFNCNVNNSKWKDFFPDSFNKERENEVNHNRKESIINLQLDITNGSGSKKQSVKDIKPTFIIIDLDYGGQLVGIDLLRKFRDAIRDSKELNGKTHLITLSRYENPYIIRTAVNNGALYYITKSNFLRIIPKIFQLELDGETVHDYENWHQLYKLDPQKILQLKSTRYKILGNDYKSFGEAPEKVWEEGYKFKEEYQWIKKLPKADLHCHIGSCMAPDLLPETALLVLAEKYKKNTKEQKETIDRIVKFLSPIAFDPYLDETQTLHPSQDNETIDYKKTFIPIHLYHDKFLSKSIFEIIDDFYPLKQNQKILEAVLLDPKNDLLSKFIRPFSAYENKEYFVRKGELEEKKVSYDEIILFFILLLSVREKGIKVLDIISLKLENFISKDIPNFSKFCIENYDHINIDFLSTRIIGNQLENFIKVLKAKIDNKWLKLSFSNSISILEFLQSAHSKQRCLANKGKGLFHYLRGCEYAGAAHLQTNTSILRTCKYIVENYSFPQNIRYLELRCAIDGYSKFGLQEIDQATQSLLAALDFYTQERYNQILINVIVTAKRHKSIREFETNVELARTFKNGLEHKGIKDKKIVVSENLTEVRRSRVVSFDLAGLERGNRPRKFLEQFMPLLKECFPITIHAGEEDDYESIWEAIYLIQSQRIGHGLTLRQDPNLLKLVRERHITIELCPISNLLTQGDNPFRFVDKDHKKDFDFSKKEIYPLRQYLNENIDVTINTDNPFINNGDLVQDFLVGAKLIGGLTKWEILRLLKNSFKGAAIPKPEKRKLMNEIDSEIYELLLNEGE